MSQRELPLSLVAVQDLVKAFPTTEGGDKRAVAGISFTVEAGEIYGLLGPNGAGKTTTLRILSGLLTPTTGTARINGFDAVEQSQEVKGAIGFLTANTGLYSRLTPRELLPYFGDLHGLSPGRIQARVGELMDWLDMHDFADLRCGALSTGQRQRTNIARALIADPPVLILDEPTLGLDVLTNRLILDFITRERDAGKAIVLSTHYLDEAERLCDRVGLMHNGKIIAEGDMTELRRKSGRERLNDIFLAIADDGFMPLSEAPDHAPAEPPARAQPLTDAGQPTE